MVAVGAWLPAAGATEAMPAPRAPELLKLEGAIGAEPVRAAIGAEVARAWEPALAHCAVEWLGIAAVPAKAEPL